MDMGLIDRQTIAGGSGAGSGWHGTSGVHTHITNTRIGDIEILERRYPVLLHKFGLRTGSGGNGLWRGGDGVVREIEVTHPLQVSILSEASDVVVYMMCPLITVVVSDEPVRRTEWQGERTGRWVETHGSNSGAHKTGMLVSTRTMDHAM